MVQPKTKKYTFANYFIQIKNEQSNIIVGK